jgi:hypothetical protein
LAIDSIGRRRVLPAYISRNTRNGLTPGYLLKTVTFLTILPKGLLLTCTSRLTTGSRQTSTTRWLG